MKVFIRSTKICKTTPLLRPALPAIWARTPSIMATTLLAPSAPLVTIAKVWPVWIGNVRWGCTPIHDAQAQLYQELMASTQGETFQLLQSIPGVGPYIAASLIGELQTMERFTK